MRADKRPYIRAGGPASEPRTIRTSRILSQRHFGLLLAIALPLLLAVQWPDGARADDAVPPLLVAQAGVGEAEPSGDDESSVIDEELDEESSEEPGGDYTDEDTEGDTDYSDIEEIRIQGRAGKMIAPDSAQSAVQFDASEIEALGAADISDIAKVTPNLEIRMAGATQANFFIRGVGLADYSANSASAVAIYQDGVPLNSAAMQLVGLFDVSSLEVLRGPQGTGSGRNASAGAIKIEAKRPTGDYQAQLRTVFGSYASPDARRALIQEYEGALELPVVEDLLSARLSFRVRAADPYMTNGCGNAPPISARVARQGANKAEASICGEWDNASFEPRNGPRDLVSTIPEGLPAAVGDQGNWAARALFRLQPTVFDMDWILNAHGGRLDQQSTLGQASGTNPGLGRFTAQRGYEEPDQVEEFSRTAGTGRPNDPVRNATLAQSLVERPLDIRPYRGDYNRVGQTTRDSWGASLTGSAFFDDVPLVGPVELLSISAYDGYKRFRDTDQDFTPVVFFERQQDDEAWQVFQELKASGERSDGLLRWELGGYTLVENLKSDVVQNIPPPADTFLRDFEQDLWSFAFYGDFGWDFLDDFTLDAGVRYNWERKRFDFSQKAGSLSPRLVAAQQQFTWDAPTALVSLKYRFSDDVAAYWKYSRGWKGGHFNANRANVPPAEPETIDSIEAGFRGSWLDARLGLNASVFYYKYENYQVFLFENAWGAPPILEILNAKGAEQYGLEVDLELRPFQDWEWTPGLLGDLQLTVRYGWLHSQFLDFVDSVLDIQNNRPLVREVDYSGNRLPNAPEHKVSVSVQWPFDFGRYGLVTPRYDLAWTDDLFFGPNEGRGTDSLLQPNTFALPKFTTGQRAYALHAVRLAYRSPDGSFEIAGWVRNLTDERYKTFSFDASIFANLVLDFVAEPRTAGVDVSFSF